MTITEASAWCLVVNATSGPITDLTIVHTAKNELTNRPPPMTLQSFETSSFVATIVEGSSDEWSVSFKVNGTTLSGSTRCDIEEVDLNSQTFVILALYDASVGFSVIPPVSSACLHTSYDGDTALAATHAEVGTPLSDWSGPVQCLIFNATGGPISDVQVAHSIGGTTQSPPVGSLNNGGTLLYTIESEGAGYGSNLSDEWSVSFVTGSVTLQRSGKQCNIEQEDFQANSCVIVALYNAMNGFSIITPVSKPCLNNQYE
ncbi:MAG TPA: hypothetical protein VFS21_33855 [Roseiflexaceae bacterium]|nr:hypothetical protein [Roseiflexaceae bacterium]